jgi:predicted RNA binding protein YcfA (HicA-like mRNA interferase family)
VSGRLPSLGARELVAALKRAGFVEHHQRGSHLTLKHEKKGIRVVVPMHAGDVKRPTLKGIINDADLTEAEFRNLL